MLKKLNFTLIVAVMMGLIACAKKQQIDPETGCAEIDIVNIIGNSTDGRSLSIQSAEIEGNDLKITASYNCGCGNSTFFLQSKANFKESFPVQTDATLVLKGKDNCLAACTTELCFDLGELKSVFEEAYPGDSSSLTIDLADFDDALSLDI